MTFLLLQLLETMKRFYLLILALGAWYCQASTSITTASVSGHWTLAGSPYLVFNNIQVDSSASLLIDAGVQVVFQGAYVLNVYGQLQATGSMAQPITFGVSDTTGWWDSTTNNGSWQGIQFLPYGGAGADASVLQYCQLSYTKFDSASVYGPTPVYTLLVARSLSVHNCVFSNNRSLHGFMIYAYTQPGQQIAFANCNFYDNNFAGPLLFIIDVFGGTSSFTGNAMQHNHSGQSLVSATAVNMVFANNLIDSNESDRGIIVFQSTASGSTTRVCHVSFTQNRVYGNTSLANAAVCCLGGMIDIDRNYICNNQHTADITSSTEGGGGLTIGPSSSGPDDSTFYTVRNNIIANNYSPFRGGGMVILFARAVVANNQIVHNSSVDGGAIYMENYLPVTIKNNVLWGNVTLPDSNSMNSPNVTGNQFSSVAYDHNWTEHSALFDLDLGTSFTVSSDTSTNITGASPELITPTLTDSVTESALGDNFTLWSTSPCIDAGDTAGAYADSVDYVGRPRIMGSRIDIGAFEIDPATLAAGETARPRAGVRMYPNPTQGTVHIESDEVIKVVTVTDALGLEVLRMIVNEPRVQLYLGNLPAGIFAVFLDGRYEGKVIRD